MTRTSTRLCFAAAGLPNLPNRGDAEVTVDRQANAAAVLRRENFMMDDCVVVKETKGVKLLYRVANRAWIEEIYLKVMVVCSMN